MLSKEAQDLLGGRSLADAIEQAMIDLDKIKRALETVSDDAITRIASVYDAIEIRGMSEDVLNLAEWIANDLHRLPIKTDDDLKP
jgi:hypothetical protein